MVYMDSIVSMIFIIHCDMNYASCDGEKKNCRRQCVYKLILIYGVGKNSANISEL